MGMRFVARLLDQEQEWLGLIITPSGGRLGFEFDVLFVGDRQEFTNVNLVSGSAESFPFGLTVESDRMLE